jgi:hypothetical protein
VSRHRFIAVFAASCLVVAGSYMAGCEAAPDGNVIIPGEQCHQLLQAQCRCCGSGETSCTARVDYLVVHANAVTGLTAAMSPHGAPTSSILPRPSSGPARGFRQSKRPLTPAPIKIAGQTQKTTVGEGCFGAAIRRRSACRSRRARRWSSDHRAPQRVTDHSRPAHTRLSRLASECSSSG